MANILMKNTKQRRRAVALLAIFLIVFLVFFFVLRKSDYELQYTVDDYTVTESYYKDEDVYIFNITKNEEVYATILENQSFSSRKLIYQIDTYEEEDEKCIVINSNQLRFSPLCRKNNEQISYHLVNDKMREHLTYLQHDYIDETYESVNIFQYDFAEYYIWNYRGFYRISQTTKETINLFSKDIYDPKLIYQIADLLFIPDYDGDYYFEKAYILNMDNGKYETWDLKERIYFDSVILGDYDNEFYLVDKHEKKEWKVNLQKKSLELIASDNAKGLTYQNGFQEVSMTKLVNQDMTFKNTTIYDYKIDNGLYKTFTDYQIRLQDNVPTRIVKKTIDRVFYLVDDTLYSYNEDYGVTKLMSYFEWNFNNNHVIFIH